MVIEILNDHSMDSDNPHRPGRPEQHREREREFGKFFGLKNLAAFLAKDKHLAIWKGRSDSAAISSNFGRKRVLKKIWMKNMALLS